MKKKLKKNTAKCPAPGGARGGCPAAELPLRRAMKEATNSLSGGRAGWKGAVPQPRGGPAMAMLGWGALALAAKLIAKQAK